MTTPLNPPNSDHALAVPLASEQGSTQGAAEDATQGPAQSTSHPTPPIQPAPPITHPSAPRPAAPRPHKLTAFLIAACAVSLLASGLLWSKLNHIQETLARQSLDASTQSVEAKTLAKSAQDSVRETSVRQSVIEAKLSEVALQRSQLEELMTSMSRSRDENLVVDIDSAVRLAQQQASLTGTAEPLLAALRAADQRIARAAQPRLTPLQRAIAKDTERIKAATLSDTPGLLVKLDELARMVDDLPLANAVAQSSGNAAVKAALAKSPAAKSTAKTASGPAGDDDTSTLSQWPQWLQTIAGAVRDEARGLVRVRRVDAPEAALLSPEQSFFVRENLKLKILNARLGLLARQSDVSRADLQQAATSLSRYFDANARNTLQAQGLVLQIQSQLKATEVPRVDDTLAALATAAAGR
jgi:uroporphyrin-III C-methyltransferase